MSFRARETLEKIIKGKNNFKRAHAQHKWQIKSVKVLAVATWLTKSSLRLSVSSSRCTATKSVLFHSSISISISINARVLTLSCSTVMSMSLTNVKLTRVQTQYKLTIFEASRQKLKTYLLWRRDFRDSCGDHANESDAPLRLQRDDHDHECLRSSFLCQLTNLNFGRNRTLDHADLFFLRDTIRIVVRGISH